MERLDVALVKRGLSPSRERAQEAIRAGCARVNGREVRRPAAPVAEGDLLELTGDPIGYVGRGGLKLEAALDHFGVDPFGRVCLDVGASTGGFTDCLLRRGAAHVFAVDVGRDQLHPTLRANPRVTSLEETDIRSLTALPAGNAAEKRPKPVKSGHLLIAPQSYPGPQPTPPGVPPDPQSPTLAVVDVSFIPLGQVLPSVYRLLAPGGEAVVLVKPQFEVGAGRLGKGGIVRDPAARREALKSALARAEAAGFEVVGSLESPVTGTEGNREFLALLRRPEL